MSFIEKTTKFAVNAAKRYKYAKDLSHNNTFRSFLFRIVIKYEQLPLNVDFLSYLKRLYLKVKC